MEKEYTPHISEMNDVTLPDELIPLIEDLARNVHDVWAGNRMREGWTYGEVRDDVAKKHPCLVKYDDLPEHEREYDRATSRATLSFILKSGFRISKQ